MMSAITKQIDIVNQAMPAQQKRAKTGSVNGHHATAHSDDEETDMDIDEPAVSAKARSVQPDDDQAVAEDPIPPEHVKAAMKRRDELFREAVTYGQELRQEYKSSKIQWVRDTMTEMFGMLAFPDPRQSEQANLLVASERVALADALNGKILSKSSSSCTH